MNMEALIALIMGCIILGVLVGLPAYERSIKREIQGIPDYMEREK